MRKVTFSVISARFLHKIPVIDSNIASILVLLCLTNIEPIYCVNLSFFVCFLDLKEKKCPENLAESNDAREREGGNRARNCGLIPSCAAVFISEREGGSRARNGGLRPSCAAVFIREREGGSRARNGGLRPSRAAVFIREREGGSRARNGGLN